MIPELGQVALILALLLALAQGTLPLIGAHRRDPALMALARPAAVAQFLCLLIAFAALAASFALKDFSVLNVARNAASQLPLVYRLTAAWGSHEGSLLLWILLLAGWGAAVARWSRALPPPNRARVLAVMGLISVGFLGFLIFTSNPFARLLPAPPDGADLNPLLQDWGMILHPPMLYMGYVGFAVAFAGASAALIDGGRTTDWTAWAVWIRPWTLAAWVCLTLGIALGSWWAYRELGWGGWWFWDPTENASLMPWLAGTALIHALAVTARRGQFVAWTLLLAMAVFALSLLGTFLIRSGVLSSVHAFANDPRRGLFILGLLALTVGGSLALYAWRHPRPVRAPIGPWSARESLLLTQTLLLLAALGTVMLGTLYPLVLDVLGLGRISVGPPYFNTLFVPLMVPLLLLMGLGPLARWRQGLPPPLPPRLYWAFALALSLAIGLPLAASGVSAFNPSVSLGLLLALWILFALALSLAERLRAPGMTLARIPRRVWGLWIAHGGLAVGVAGIALVTGYEVERDVRLEVGERVEIAGHGFTFHGTEPVTGPNYVADRGRILVDRGHAGETLWLYPEKRRYLASNMAMTEAAVHSRFAGDLYLALGEPLGGSAWSLRIYVKPFIGWLWAGAFLMALGGTLAAADRRRRPVPARAGAFQEVAVA